jgi:mono/diheme cytochrome c family protein
MASDVTRFPEEGNRGREKGSSQRSAGQTRSAAAGSRAEDAAAQGARQGSYTPHRRSGPRWLAWAVLALAGAAWAFLQPASRPGRSMAADSSRQHVERPPTTDTVAVSSAALKAGGTLYDEHCLTCHQENGKGVPGTFPPLAGNRNLSNLRLIVETVHGGHSGKITVNGKTFDQTMPALGAGFSALEIAEVATFIRNSWGNDFGGVELSAVKKLLLGKGSAKAESTSSALPVDGALLKKGQTLYELHCMTCHQSTGKGIPGTFPPLVDNATLSDAGFIFGVVHNGHSGSITVNGITFDQTMPAIGTAFSAEELAAVATYIRNSWGNDFGGVTTKEAERFLQSGKAAGE